MVTVEVERATELPLWVSEGWQFSFVRIMLFVVGPRTSDQIEDCLEGG
jgi:hypothetical protein